MSNEASYSHVIFNIMLQMNFFVCLFFCKKDELHSRLRFVRRGLVAMANAGPHDNGSQFFFTLGATPELNSKHTIFGKVIYNFALIKHCSVR